jgi:formylglycine-generating enzyme required for sulfatase activity
MTPNHLPPGYLLNHRYSIQKCLGQGGFGITYLAYDPILNLEVCIKELYISGYSTRGVNNTVQSQMNGGLTFQNFIKRFIQEAQQLAPFRHPNIVRVLDVFEHNQTAYMVMEFVAGETLKHKIQREGAMNAADAINLFNQLFDAVEEVHKKGLLHRDIKPDNIMLTSDGRVVLIDFGSARDFTEGQTSTQTAMITPGYAPPEQYSDRNQRGTYTDIYALGATLYYLLTGEKPIAATERHLEVLLPPHELKSDISILISNAVIKAMELKPNNRFQQIKDFREYLKTPKPPGPSETLNKIKKLFNEYKIEVVILVILIGAITIGYSGSSSYEYEDDGIVKAQSTGNSMVQDKEAETAASASQQNTSSNIEKFPIEMVYIAEGTFTMGCTADQIGACDNDEIPVHQVTLNAFYIGKYEVTQAQWREVMGNNPSHFSECDNCPVDNVSWNEVQGFIRKLNQKTGMNFRLPTEAEWEYAARGGNQSRGYTYSGGNRIDGVAWYADNSGNKTHPVGQKSPNELGIYDMSGNVWEWCTDWFGAYSSAGQNNPKGAHMGPYRVLRGGSWFNYENRCRNAYRLNYMPDKHDHTIGFRLVYQK